MSTPSVFLLNFFSFLSDLVTCYYFRNFIMALNKANETAEITTIASTGSLDDNYELYKSMRGVAIDPLEAKKVSRKVDLRILPLLMTTYFLQYLDKNSINIASVYGLDKDTHLEGQDYSWLSLLTLRPSGSSLLTSDHSYNLLHRVSALPISQRAAYSRSQ
jgi:hypothetical protein